jgi:hypothetical protein
MIDWDTCTEYDDGSTKTARYVAILGVVGMYYNYVAPVLIFPCITIRRTFACDRGLDEQFIWIPFHYSIHCSITAAYARCTGPVCSTDHSSPFRSMSPLPLA